MRYLRLKLMFADGGRSKLKVCVDLIPIPIHIPRPLTLLHSRIIKHLLALYRIYRLISYYQSC